MALVVLGKVVRAVGLRGHLGVAGTEGAVARVKRLTLRRPGAREDEGVEAQVENARPQGRIWAVKVAGIQDRTEAERWVGAEVLAERDELGDPGEGRYFWADLEGRPVFTVAGEDLGKVTGLYETGGVDVLVVTRDGQERLIPLAPYVEVDVKGGRIVVDPPDGLLDV